MNTLILCPIGVGNYVMAYPACARLKQQNPSLRLTLLGLRESIRNLAHGDPLWDSIVIFDPTKIARDYPAQLRIVRSLQKMQFDASLSLFPSNKWQYNLLPFLARIPKRYGFAYSYAPLSKLNGLLTHKHAVNPELHDVLQNMSLADFFSGAATDQKEIVFPALFDESEKRWAALLFPANRRYLAVHPGSSDEHGMIAKRWAPEKFAALADKICAALDAEALLLGGNDEQPLKARVAASMKRPSHVVEQVSLRKTAAILARCDISLCNDSGLMHMAACAGVPTIGIFGPTDEKRNGPFGQKTLAVRKPMENFPLWRACNVGNRSLPAGIDPQASLKALSVEHAWMRIEPWLAEYRQ